MTYKGWILCRISSKDQSQGDSLESQEQKGKELLHELGIASNQIKVFREVFSGWKDIRPVFNQVMRFSKEHADSLEYGCIFDIDRFSRAGAGFYDQSKKELKNLGIQLIDANRIIQPERNMLAGSGKHFGADFQYEWSTFSTSESTEIQRAQQAKEELRKILLRTISKQIHYVQNGYQVRQASYGFRNVKKVDPETGKKRAYFEFEPKEAPLLTKMYEYAEMIHNNICTVEIACKKINKLGYKSRQFNRWNEDKTRIIGKSEALKLTPKKFWQYIRKPINAGFYCEKWTRQQLVPAKSPRLISIDLWNKANQGKFKIIKDEKAYTGWRLLDINLFRKQSYRKVRGDYPYKGLICCPKCKKPLKAAASTGKSGKRFPIYFCNRGHKQVSINPTNLDKLLREVLKELTFSKKSSHMLEKALKKHFYDQLNITGQFMLERDQELIRLRKKADRIYQRINILTNYELIQRSEEDYKQVQREIEDIESNRVEMRHSEKDLLVMIENIKNIIEHLDELLLDTDDISTLSGLWNCIFLTPPTLEDLERRTLNLSPIIEFKKQSEDDKNGWHTQEHLHRTLFNELLRWSQILKWIDYKN